MNHNKILLQKIEPQKIEYQTNWILKNWVLKDLESKSWISKSFIPKKFTLKNWNFSSMYEGFNLKLIYNSKIHSLKVVDKNKNVEILKFQSCRNNEWKWFSACESETMQLVVWLCTINRVYDWWKGIIKHFEYVNFR